MTDSCLACSLADGSRPLPGGRIHSTEHWAVEHCIGPLGVGTLIVKPLRHVLHVADLTADESAELGPLLQHATAVVMALTEADQVYVCLWSHAGWQAVHIHFVVQPTWNTQRSSYRGAGPTMQSAMFDEGDAPNPADVEAFCDRARDAFLAGAGARR